MRPADPRPAGPVLPSLTSGHQTRSNLLFGLADDGLYPGTQAGCLNGMGGTHGPSRPDRRRFVGLHVRVVSPATVTGQLAGTLATAAGVQNVVVQAGARRPDGDAAHFDVRDEAANPVRGALRDLGLDRSGVICMERVDAALTGQPQVTADHGALRRETAPVWEMVKAIICGGQAYAPSFYVLLAVAGLIGAVGLITNSQVLIVAAMVVGPEYNAIIAVALGISRRDRGAVRDGLLALLWGFLAAIAVTLLFGPAVRVRQGSCPVPGRRPAGRGFHQHARRVLSRRGRAGWHGGRGVPDPGPGQRPDRRVHLGHYHPGRRIDRRVDRVLELGRSPGIRAAAAAQRRRAHRGRCRRPHRAAQDLALAHIPAARPVTAGEHNRSSAGS